MTRFARTHICAHPFIKLGPPIGLAYGAIGLFTTQMTTDCSVMCLIKDTILEVLIVRNHNTRRIRNIRAIAQQPMIDRISMEART